jgi:hypothetical protein
MVRFWLLAFCALSHVSPKTAAFTIKHRSKERAQEPVSPSLAAAERRSKEGAQESISPSPAAVALPAIVRGAAVAGVFAAGVIAGPMLSELPVWTTGSKTTDETLIVSKHEESADNYDMKLQMNEMSNQVIEMNNKFFWSPIVTAAIAAAQRAMEEKFSKKSVDKKFEELAKTG